MTYNYNVQPKAHNFATTWLPLTWLPTVEINCTII